MRGAIPPLSQYDFMAWCSVVYFSFTYLRGIVYLQHFWVPQDPYVLRFGDVRGRGAICPMADMNYYGVSTCLNGNGKPSTYSRLCIWRGSLKTRSCWIIRYTSRLSVRYKLNLRCLQLAVSWDDMVTMTYWLSTYYLSACHLRVTCFLPVVDCNSIQKFLDGCFVLMNWTWTLLWCSKKFLEEHASIL
jgi:hypothetical protein